MRASIVTFTLLLSLSASAQPTRYVVAGARIYTSNAAQPVAAAMAVENGRIVAVGSDEALASYADWPRLDAAGQTVVPGLIDAHAHLMGLGEFLSQADLTGTASVEEIQARLTGFAETLPADAWVTGGGWDQNDWGGSGAFPTRLDLDAVLADRPVSTERVDKHAIWVNSSAMRAAGIDPEAPAPADPPGGQIVRDAQGRPTGVFLDEARALIESSIPPPSFAFYTEALQRALAETASSGLTGIHDAGVALGTLALYRRAIAQDQFPLRVSAMIQPGEIGTFCAGGGPTESARLVVRSVKVYADGALGSRGAALLDEYSDDAGNHGLFRTPPDSVRAIAERAMRCGLQVNTHAIGDAANHAVLDAYEASIATTGGGAGRHRIEHAQVLTLTDIERLGALGLIASVQPTHATSDMPWAQTRLGADRVRGAYAWRRLRDAGARIALGSDFPVERVSPVLGFYAAVTRQDDAQMPAGGWFGNQAMSRTEALHGFTIDAAYAGFMEDEVGSLEVGKRADFVILSQDLMRVPPEQILATRVVATYLDGAPIYHE